MLEILEERCIYNLRLIHKIPLEQIDIKCFYLCNGSNKKHTDNDEEEVHCDYYVDSVDYYREICALKIRAKRKADREINLFKEEIYCLKECSGKKDVDCNAYVNVMYVVNEICGHKVRVEKKLRNKVLLEGLEYNCASCIGDKHLARKCNKFYSLRDFHEFDILFIPVDAISTSA